LQSFYKNFKVEIIWKKIVSFIKKNLPYPRYKNPFQSLEERFVLPEKKGVIWRDYIEDIAEKGGFIGFLKFAKATVFTKIDSTNEDVCWFIEEFTCINDERCSDDFINRKMEYLKKDIQNVSINGREKLKFKFRDRDITVIPMSFALKDVLKEKDLKELQTEERYHKCHEKSVEYAKELKADCVTGKTWTFSPKDTGLHSWVETKNKKGEEIILDYTKNLIMKKDEYYFLNNVKVLQRNNYRELLDDEEWARVLTNYDGNYIKLYLSSRDEAYKEYLKLKKQSEEFWEKAIYVASGQRDIDERAKNEP